MKPSHPLSFGAAGLAVGLAAGLLAGAWLAPPLGRCLRLVPAAERPYDQEAGDLEGAVTIVIGSSRRKAAPEAVLGGDWQVYRYPTPEASAAAVRLVLRDLAKAAAAEPGEQRARP
jgi:hypothetical protein